MLAHQCVYSTGVQLNASWLVFHSLKVKKITKSYSPSVGCAIDIGQTTVNRSEVML